MRPHSGRSKMLGLHQIHRTPSGETNQKYFTFLKNRSFSVTFLNNLKFVFSLMIFINLCDLVNSSNSVVINNSEESTMSTQFLEEFETTTPFFTNDIVDDLMVKAWKDLPLPSIRISVVNLATGELDELLSDKANETIVTPVGKFILSEGQDVPKMVIRFDCNASYPVEWIFLGSGAPFDVTSRSFRHIENFTDPSTYRFSAFLDLTQNVERNTGKYLCIPMQSKMKDGVFFQLYVPGKKLFLNMKSKITRVPENATEFIIPCTLSNTRALEFIKLYRDNKKTGQSPVSYKSSYNANVGFTISIDSTTSIREYNGKYFCKDIMTGRISQKHTIITATGNYARVNPPTNFVKILPGLKQVFICAAKENVTLTFSGDRQPRIVDFETNPGAEYPYLAIFEINPMNITSEHTIINCVTNNDEILHTWEYSTYDDVSISNFYFDGHKRYQDARYVCCSKSYYKPKMEFTFCKTETECALKKLIFDEDNETKEGFIGEYSHRISYLNSSCVMFNPYLKYTLPSGMLRCSVKGINEEFHRDYMYYFNPYRIYQAYSDDRFDASKVLSSESIMKLSKTPSKNTLVGQKQRFLCYYSELFLSNGVVWSIHYINGSSHVLDSSYNAMKSNASFSQIELTLDDTNIDYIRCFAPVKDSLTEWKNVTGPLFVRNIPKIRATVQTSSGDVLKELHYNSSVGLILESDTLNVYNNSIDTDSNLETFLVLECNASFPIDFTYFGEGSPKVDYLPRRKINGSVLFASSYSYSAKLVFHQISRETIGKYSCVSSTREFGHRGQEENLRANVNIFVPGEKLFISTDNQTFRAFEYRDSVLIPCPIEDPRVNITLEKFSNETRDFELLNSTLEIPYDPLHGFSLTKNHTSNLFGLYKCFGDRNRSSGIIQVYLPSDAIKVDPFVKEVKILANETQKFKCESTENVTMIFSDGNISREIMYSTDLTSKYPYKAIYETKLGEFTNLTVINCTSLKDSKSMHTWELFPGDGAFIDEFTYNNKTNEMKCCTKSYRTPQIEWVNCTSVTECYMKQTACLTQNKCQPGDYTLKESFDKSNLKNGCLSISLKDRPQGLLKCVVKGMHKIVAQALVYYYNPEKDFEVHDGYFLGTKMFDKFDVRNQQVMKLTKSPENNITTGDIVKFDCVGSKFFVSSEMQWALEMQNGTMRYYNGNDMTNYNQVRSTLELKFETNDWKSVYCIAPNWKEYFGWRNVSLPLDFNVESESTTIDSFTVDIV